MTKAPERIWAWPFIENKQDDVITGGWTHLPDKKEQEYIRADQVQALMGEFKGLEAWAAALRELIEDTSCDPDDPDAFDEILLCFDLQMQSAQKALAPFEGE